MTRMGVSKDPSLLGEDGLVSRHLAGSYFCLSLDRRVDYGLVMVG